MTYVIFKMENRVFVTYTNDKKVAMKWADTRDGNRDFIYDYETVDEKAIMHKYWNEL